MIRNRKQKSKKKAQAALEFLVTYGWAIGVIIIIVGALTYFGVFDLNKYVRDYCTFGPQLECLDYEISSNSVGFYVKNNFGFPIQIINYTVIYEGIPRATYVPSTTTNGTCLSISGPENIDLCKGITDPYVCENTPLPSLLGGSTGTPAPGTPSACTYVKGYIDNDEALIINSNDWNSTDILTLPTGRKREVDIEIYFRRIDPAYANASTQIHKLRGIIFTEIK